VIGSVGTAPTCLILVELRALKKDFAAAGISLRAENEVRLTVCIAVAAEMHVLGIVEIMAGREAAMIRIGNGRQGLACFRNGPKEAEARDGDKSAMRISWMAFYKEEFGAPAR
jgi:hypothetical protein